MVQGRSLIGIVANVICLTLLAAVAWLLLASGIFVHFANFDGELDYPWLAVWTYWPGDETPTRILLVASIAAPPVGCGLILLIVYRLASRRRFRAVRRWPWQSGLRQPREAVTANHGDTRFMLPQEADKAFPGGGVNGGLAVAAPRHGTRPWIDNRSTGSGHSMDIAGSDAGKTRVATLDQFTWIGSAAILDPACFIGPATCKSLEDDGYRVIILDPDGDVGFNAVDWIDINDKLAEQHVRTVVTWAFGDAPKAGGGDMKSATFFYDRGKDLCECLLSHAMWEPGWNASLFDMKDGLDHSSSEIMLLLTHIKEKSHSCRARGLAAGLMVGTAFEMFEGILSTATTATSWLSIGAYMDMVCGDSFKAADIHGPERTRIFIQVPMDGLLTSPGVARVAIGALMNAMIQANGRGHQKEVLFLLDEAVLLGAMTVLKVARSQGRKYGIRLHLIWQSQAQIAEVWGRDGCDAWLDGVNWRSYSAIGSRHIADEVSREMGKYGVLAYSEGVSHSRQSTGGRSIFSWTNSSNQQLNEHEIGKDLMTADQIMRMRSDEVIVLSKGNYPLRAVRPFWHDYPEIVALVEADANAEPPTKPVAEGNRVRAPNPATADAGAVAGEAAGEGGSGGGSQAA